MTAPAVVFDLDGVLVDSEPYWREGFRAALATIAADLGAPTPRMSDEELAGYEGGRVSDTVRTLAGASFGRVPEATVARAAGAAIDRAVALVREDPRPITASVTALRELARRGFRVGVASSSAPEFIETVLAGLGLADMVDATASAFHLRHAKPHPEVYLNVLAALDVPPEGCTAVEDSWTGVRSALGAGLRTVWLTPSPAEAVMPQVKEFWKGHPRRDGRPRPPLMVTHAVDADAVQEFSEARS